VPVEGGLGFITTPRKLATSLLLNSIFPSFASHEDSERPRLNLRLDQDQRVGGFFGLRIDCTTHTEPGDILLLRMDAGCNSGKKLNEL